METNNKKGAAPASTLPISWKAALFDADDIVVSKESVAAPASEFTATHQFFCINPMERISTLKENVTKFRNILVEFDELDPMDQWYLITEQLELPFTTCTYSGGNSLHFIISLTSEITSGEYTELVGLLYKAIGNNIDGKCGNPNRLSRLPGAVRGDTIQELIEVRARVPIEELIGWIAKWGVPKETNWQKVRKHVEGKRELPGIYKDVLEGRAMHPEARTRHDSLVKLGVWINNNGYTEEELEEMLEAAESAWGLTGRGDASSIYKWLTQQQKR